MKIKLFRWTRRVVKITSRRVQSGVLSQRPPLVGVLGSPCGMFQAFRLLLAHFALGADALSHGNAWAEANGFGPGAHRLVALSSGAEGGVGILVKPKSHQISLLLLGARRLRRPIQAKGSKKNPTSYYKTILSITHKTLSIFECTIKFKLTVTKVMARLPGGWRTRHPPGNIRTASTVSGPLSPSLLLGNGQPAVAAYLHLVEAGLSSRCIGMRYRRAAQAESALLAGGAFRRRVP